jgi:hypothetical protein
MPLLRRDASVFGPVHPTPGLDDRQALNPRRGALLLRSRRAQFVALGARPGLRG